MLRYTTDRPSLVAFYDIQPGNETGPPGTHTGPKDDGGCGNNWSYKMNKAQSDRQHQQTNIQFTGQMPLLSCHPTNSVKALKGNLSTTSNVCNFLYTGIETIFLNTTKQQRYCSSSNKQLNK